MAPNSHRKKAQPYGCAFLCMPILFSKWRAATCARFLYWRPYTVERYIIPSVNKVDST